MALRDAADKQQVFIEWLCTPKRERNPSTQEELARRLRLGVSVLTNWKKQPQFLERWDQHYLSTIGSPERKQTLLDTLYGTGSDRDDPRHVQAAAKYMELVDGLKPQRLDITVNRPAKDLSDEELDRIAAAFVQRERDAREREQEAS